MWPMYTLQLSVRTLVEAIYLGGDLVSTSQSVERANLGSRIHRLLQSQATGNYQSEVYLNITTELEEFQFTIDGRADGIYTREDGVCVEEIKSTYVPYDELNDQHLVHFAQAYVYAYIYAAQHQLEQIDVKLTYYQIEDEKVKSFQQRKTLEELETFYMDTLRLYLTWANLKRDLQQRAITSLHDLSFPFPDYRKGQRQFAVGVYKTVLDRDILFAQAPTGIGKTISTLFPSLKAIGEDKCEKIFYLCAKTITASVAFDTVTLLYEHGATFKTVGITAKDKMCLLEKRNCDPAVCPYAKGYYDRCQDALYELINQQDMIVKEVIEPIAKKHMVCPFELNLDASLYADVIICDYNYVFDPRVYLKRFFMEKGNYIFLVDEAHNLVDRAREMYSASLTKSKFLEIKSLIPKERKLLHKSISSINKAMLTMRKECEQHQNFLAEETCDEGFLQLVARFQEAMDAYFQSDHDERHDDTLKEVYFDCVNFCKVSDFYDENFVTYQTSFGHDCTIKQFCMNPVNPLKQILKKGRSTIFFSATLSPIDYYLSLLGGDEQTKRLSLPSPFDSSQLCCLINDRISTKYEHRTASLASIVMNIYAATSAKAGNYIIFAPSYAYMKQIYETFTLNYPEIETTMQQQNMEEQEKQEFLSSFEETASLHLYFCVIGGMFSEGIDLKEEKLIGAIIIGVGLAQINPQQDLIMHHFNKQNQAGFSYAYQFPGMNKVLQSAGRVIRSRKDKGMVLFLDERYTTARYLTLLPSHFRHYQRVTSPSDLMHTLHKFWEQS